MKIFSSVLNFHRKQLIYLVFPESRSALHTEEKKPETRKLCYDSPTTKLFFSKLAPAGNVFKLEMLTNQK
jgi:hypothetical protein